MSQFRNGLLAALLASTTALASLAAHAETISGALAKAYHLNSELNSARAGVRVTDENVPIAKSGYRPTITGSGAVDYSVTRNRLNLAGNSTTNLFTGSFGVQIQQTLFDGFQTRNNVAGRRGAGQRLRREPAQHRAEHPVQRGLAPTWTSSATGRSRFCASATSSSWPSRCGPRARASRSARVPVPTSPRPKPAARSAVAAAGSGARAGAVQRGDLPAGRRRGAGQARPRRRRSPSCLPKSIGSAQS